jgi:hypothetical protein
MFEAAMAVVTEEAVQNTCVFVVKPVPMIVMVVSDEPAVAAFGVMLVRVGGGVVVALLCTGNKRRPATVLL